MLHFDLTSENPESENVLKENFAKSFPGKSSDEIYDILNSYDEAYLSSREYFSYYFPMTTETVINYINDNKLGHIWQLITDALFNEGVISLYTFIDKHSDKYRNILERSKKMFGFPISTYNKNRDYIKNVRTYRNQRAAHFGKDYFEENSSIRYDEPIIMLEHLRRDRNHFDRKYLEMENSIYENLQTYFSSKIPTVIKMLNIKLDADKVNKELTDYLDSVILDNFDS